ncbi:hypothetical protein M758_1G041600, partial [Ceratodon purpureus]
MPILTSYLVTLSPPEDHKSTTKKCRSQFTDPKFSTYESCVRTSKPLPSNLTTTKYRPSLFPARSTDPATGSWSEQQHDATPATPRPTEVTAQYQKPYLHKFLHSKTLHPERNTPLLKTNKPVAN